MVLITEELIRKKSEHNEGIIGTLEELSLHQEDVEKIDHIHNWCKEIQILYLQSNLIPKIENLHKLKKLQYLNLAINNVEKIENLEGCESLKKLDLTLNFIGDIESVCSLANNINLRQLYLTGNPCADFEGYREYVVAKLPQLQYLDNKEITRSERIKALQILQETEAKVKASQVKYQKFRTNQRERLQTKKEEVDDDTFWKTSSENAPETRTEISQRSHKNKKCGKDETLVKKKSVKLFTKDGRPLNVNQAKLSFVFIDDDPMQFILDVAIYKHLDTNFIDVDLQPLYVKILIKNAVFQFVLPEEIFTERSTAQRSQITGHLVIKMPRVNYKETQCKTAIPNSNQLRNKEKKQENKQNENTAVSKTQENNVLDFSQANSSSLLTNENAEIPSLEYV